MNKAGPIIIKDDSEDGELLNDAFKELNYKNKVIFLSHKLRIIPDLFQTKEEHQERMKNRAKKKK